jgi:hypothetical protein
MPSNKLQIRPVATQMTYRVLTLQSSDKPLDHSLHPLLLTSALGDGCKQGWVFTPVGRELGKRSRR